LKEGKVSKLPESKPHPTIKFLVVPIICALLLIGIAVLGSLLTKGDNLVVIYQFNHYFPIFMGAMLVIIFFSIMFTVGEQGAGSKENWLVFANLALMLGLIVLTFIGILSWTNKPIAALGEVYVNRQPVITDFFTQESIIPLVTPQVPRAPYTVVEAELTLNSSGNYLFTKPKEIEPDAEVYRPSFKQNLHLLEIIEAGGTPEDYQSIVVVVRTWVDTHRRIKLDRGSVPELRQRVDIYIVDAASWTVVEQPISILGGRAHRPIGGPGAGTIYLSEVKGKEVEYKTIQKILVKIIWE
jgi:hypothetical protein